MTGCGLRVVVQLNSWPVNVHILGLKTDVACLKQEDLVEYDALQVKPQTSQALKAYFGPGY